MEWRGKRYLFLITISISLLELANWGIIRVEVSSDNGKTWKCADLLQSPDQDLEHMWAWTQWNVELPVPEEALDQKHSEIICKATDRSYNTQPETPAGLWNVRGLLHNAWHRVPITFGWINEWIGIHVNTYILVITFTDFSVIFINDCFLPYLFSYNHWSSNGQLSKYFKIKIPVY